MEAKGVLIEYTNNTDVLTSSGILFDKRWILFPAASLITSLQERYDVVKIVKNISPGQLWKQNPLDINQDNTKIVLQSNLNKFNVFPVRFIAMFSCKNIRKSDTLPLVCGQYSDDKFQEINYLLSLFVILDIDLNKEFVEDELIKSINKLLQYCYEAKKGDDIFIESCPFGSRDLVSSLSQGIVSNCFGENDCYFLTDAIATPGCEGGLVMLRVDKKRQKDPGLFGIVISCLNLWRGEHTGLTLGANLKQLLLQFSRGKQISICKYLPKLPAMSDLIDNSVVQICCGNGWGTGILVDKSNGIFMTAAHVVCDAPNASISVRWKNRYFPGLLIFKTNRNSAFDIAVVQCGTRYVTDMCHLKFSNESPWKGEQVLVAGYPIFNSQYEYCPTIFKGIISLFDHDILHTSCNVLAGNSGGPIMKENGELVGIVSCHTTISHDNKTSVYPKINMGIPVSVFRTPITEYLIKKDKSILEKLNCYEMSALNKWRLFQSKL